MPMLPDLHGLYVDFGWYSPREQVWVREPYAEFTCPAGYARYAAGPAHVQQLCRAIDAWHSLNCPARKATP